MPYGAYIVGFFIFHRTDLSLFNVFFEKKYIHKNMCIHEGVMSFIMYCNVFCVNVYIFYLGKWRYSMKEMT